MRLFLLCALGVLCGEIPLLAAPLPLGKVPPGKVFLVVLPHHDDHTWEYGFGGLIAKFVDAGYTGYYIRVSNDEKDGASWADDDITNHRECLEAVRFLGMKDVISLNWRNDHSDSVPLNEIRAQLVLLFRKYKPEAVFAYNPWGHYDRNPDHRTTARAVAEAVLAAGNPNFYPEHLKLGLQPHRVLYRYFSQRSDYGHGYDPNIAVELTPAEMQRKAQAFWMNRSARLQPSLGHSIRAQLAQAGLRIPELDGLSDLDATKKLQEWRMYWISEKRGKENGVKYAEVFYFQDAFDDLPGLKDAVLGGSAPAESPSRPAPATLVPRQAARVLVVTAHADDYLLYAGGALAGLIAQGAAVRVIRVTNDEKEGRGLTPEQAALHNSEEAEQAARALGVQEVVSLGYREGELAAVSPTELRDRILFYIRLYQPDALFLPNPDTHYDDNLDHYYAGSAAEEARWAAAVRNFEPPFALAGLRRHLTPELYYYAPPVDPRRREAESTATFTPQPRIVDIAATFDRKLRAVRALQTLNHSVAAVLQARLAATGRRLPLLDSVTAESVSRLAEIRLRNLARDAAQGSPLSLAEEFEYAGPEFQTPSAYRAAR
ncbi:MAG TPA: PIG-L family deacetylase [Bryobacterales bacterium]|nr:PIG-L family deacetylase [Bryobacterales bacterium]